MTRLITSLIAALTVASIQAQVPANEMPKLVVGITIDQLRGDYLELFKYSFSERGFKRLLNEGLVYDNLKFDFPNVDDASAIATIYTGTTPYYHNVVGRKRYIAKKGQEEQTYLDGEFLGNYSQEKLSPLALKTSNIIDELKAASSGLSDAYVFAVDASQALGVGGRSANCAFWVDDHTGQWASTTYYRDFYWVVDQENRGNNSNIVRGWGKFWTPLERKSYNALPYVSGTVSFQHNFGTDKNTYNLFKHSPLVNQSVVDIATKLLESAELGKRATPDFLGLTFYAGGYPECGDYSIEIQDLYARLDKQIEKLIDEVDKKVGLQNALFFVTSTGYYNYSDRPNKAYPDFGTFYVNRCEALLNMYLMAIYGEGQWVDKFYNKQIYLNRKLVENKELSLKEVQQKAAEFVSDFSGVQDVYTSYQLRHGEWNSVMEYYKNGYTVNSSGDLFIEIQPGYKVVNEQDATLKTKIARNNAVVCPVIFYGCGIKPERIRRTIKATEIAPTVSHILRIRPPTGATEQPLREIFK